MHKHLESCYAKLDVADRLSAVIRAQRLGLVPAARRGPVALRTNATIRAIAAGPPGGFHRADVRGSLTNGSSGGEHLVMERRFGVRGMMARHERDWMEFVAALMAEPLTEYPAQRIALRLGETFDGLGCSFNDIAPGRAPTIELYPLRENLSGYRDQIEEWSIERAAEEHPLLRFYIGTGLRVPIRTHDVPATYSDPRVCGEWTALARSCHCQDQMALPLRLQPGVHRAFVLGRGEPFTDAELDLGRVLWRVLTGLDRQVSAFVRARREMGAAGHDVASAIRLTPRESAVLTLLSQGLTAGAIGRRLDIAERTVHKHLERCYSKLGVADRLSAVLRAQRLGLFGAVS